MADASTSAPLPGNDTINAATAQMIASAVGAAVTASMAAVTTSVNEVTAKLNELESRIKQTSVNDDTNFEASVTGAYDMFDDLRRTNMSRDRIASYAELALSHAIEIAHGVGLRSLDHFCATNPEVTPRTTKGA